MISLKNYAGFTGVGYDSLQGFLNWKEMRYIIIMFNKNVKFQARHLLYTVYNIIILCVLKIK